MYYSKTEYKLKGFERSNTKNKKYDAILINKTTKKEKRIPFGDSRYQQYKDTTGLKLFSNKDHGDSIRRNSYRKRHSGEIQTDKYSAGYFSMNYLWG